MAVGWDVVGGMGCGGWRHGVWWLEAGVEAWVWLLEVIRLRLTCA